MSFPTHQPPQRSRPRASRLGLAVLAVLALQACASQPRGDSASHTSLRILSWNIAGDPLQVDAAAFRAVIERAAPDILVLDEAAPTLDLEHLLATLEAADSSASAWNLVRGASGGRQRVIVASRWPLEEDPELNAFHPYPQPDVAAMTARWPDTERDNEEWQFDLGIPTAGAVVHQGDRRLLVVGVDLQCCGNETDSWEEYRRRVEAREIRRLVRETLARREVDGLVVAGDFNIVATATPLVLLCGPYGPRHRALSPVDLYHLDGETSWTWDGRGSRFDSIPMDFQLYGSRHLEVRGGFILDTRDLPSTDRARYGLSFDTTHQLSDHRPLVVEYSWSAD